MDASVYRAAKSLYDFLSSCPPAPAKADLLLALGSHDLRVPDHAAALYLAGAAPLIGKILPLLPKRKKAADQLLDPDYDIGYDVIPTPRLTDLKKLIRMAKERLSGVRCPVLCAQSQKDPDISKDSADVILAGVSSARKEKLTLTQPLHVITIGPETDTLFPAVCRFILDCTKENS